MNEIPRTPGRTRPSPDKGGSGLTPKKNPILRVKMNLNGLLSAGSSQSVSHSGSCKEERLDQAPIKRVRISQRTGKEWEYEEHQIDMNRSAIAAFAAQAKQITDTLLDMDHKVFHPVAIKAGGSKLSLSSLLSDFNVLKAGKLEAELAASETIRDLQSRLAFVEGERDALKVDLAVARKGGKCFVDYTKAIDHFVSTMGSNNVISGSELLKTTSSYKRKFDVDY